MVAALFFAVVHVGGIAKEACIETRWGYVNRQFHCRQRFDWGCEVGHNSRNAAPHCNQSNIEGVPDVEKA